MCPLCWKAGNCGPKFSPFSCLCAGQLWPISLPLWPFAKRTYLLVDVQLLTCRSPLTYSKAHPWICRNAAWILLYPLLHPSFLELTHGLYICHTLPLGLWLWLRLGLLGLHVDLYHIVQVATLQVLWFFGMDTGCFALTFFTFTSLPSSSSSLFSSLPALLLGVKVQGP